MRSISITALVAQMLVCPKAGESQNRVKRITIDLAGPTIDSVLPFDERFLLVGPATDALMCVEVQYWRVNEGAPSDTATSCEHSPRGASAAAWHRLQSVTSTQFELLVGPLDADQGYVFRFKVVTKPTTQEIQQFQSAVAERLDRDSRKRPGTGHKADETVAAAVSTLCDSLPTFFETTRASHSVRARPGSLLDCQEPGLLGHFVQLAWLLDYTAARSNAVSTAGSAAVRTLNGLRILANDSGGALRRAAQTVAAIPEAKTYIALALRVRSLDPEAIGELADGTASIAEPQTAGLVPTGDAWAPSDLAPRILSLGGLELALDSLRGLAILALQQAAPKLPPRDSIALTQLLASVTRLAVDVRQEEGALRRMSVALALRRTAIDTAAHQLAVAASEDVELQATTTASFLTRGGWYISSNIGIAFFPAIGEVSPIVGANFYFTPVNRDVPLRNGDCGRRRLSLVIAVTTGSIALAGQRDDLFASRGMVIGAGYRVSDILQLSAGALVLRAPNRDPAVDHSTIQLTPYAAVAIDATLATLLGTFTSAIFK